jgi:hypothetical protein
MIRGVCNAAADLLFTEVLDLITDFKERADLYSHLVQSFPTLVGPSQCWEMRQRHDTDDDKKQENGPHQLALVYESRAFVRHIGPDADLQNAMADDLLFNWERRPRGLYEYAIESAGQQRTLFVRFDRGQHLRFTWQTNNVQEPVVFSLL